MIINRQSTDRARRYVFAPHSDYPASTSAIQGVWVPDGYEVEWIQYGNQVIGYKLIPQTEQARIALDGNERC